MIENFMSWVNSSYSSIFSSSSSTESSAENSLWSRLGLDRFFSYITAWFSWTKTSPKEETLDASKVQQKLEGEAGSSSEGVKNWASWFFAFFSKEKKEETTSVAEQITAPAEIVAQPVVVPKTTNEDLFSAVKENRIEEVKNLLQQEGMDPNARNELGSNFLTVAAYNGHNEIVSLLLDREDTVLNEKNLKGRTPLTIAISAKKAETVKLLLANARLLASLSVDDVKEAAVRAVEMKDVETLKLLLALNKFKINDVISNGQTLLMIAADKNVGHEVIAFLCQQKDCNLATKEVNSALEKGRTAYQIGWTRNMNPTTLALLKPDKSFFGAFIWQRT